MGDYAIFWLPGLMLTAWCLVLVARSADQISKDGQRKGYSITFPEELETEEVVAWLSTLGEIDRRYNKLSPAGTWTVTLETVYEAGSIRHRLRVPGILHDHVVNGLRSHIKGIRVDEVTARDDHNWRYAVEVGLRSENRLLRIASPEAIAESVLNVGRAVQPGERLLVQWVVAPGAERDEPNENTPTSNKGMRLLYGNRAKMTAHELAEARKKLSQVNLAAVLRVAAVATTDGQARHLVEQVRKAIAATGKQGARFYRRVDLTGTIADRVNNARGSLHFPITVMAGELAALIGWPVGLGHVIGLQRGRARQLPASPAVPRTGRVFAMSDYPGDERPLAISVQDSRRHLHVVGPTGVGKTTLLGNLIAQDMARDAGVIVLETKGGDDLFHTALDYIPKRRIKDTIIVDVTDTDYPVGLNVLQGTPQVAASNLYKLFASVYGNKGVRMPEGMYNGLMTLMTTTATTEPPAFPDLIPLFVPSTAAEEAWSDAIIRGVPDERIRVNFWQPYQNKSRKDRDEFFAPIRDRIWQLTSRPEIFGIIAQSKSGFEVAEAIRQKKIILINLHGLGSDTASLFGTLIFNLIWSAVRNGAANPADPTMFYADEFQRIINIPADKEEIFNEARGFGLAMTVAHQDLSQLNVDPKLRGAVMANALSKIVFRVGPDDAAPFVREFGRKVVTEEDFMGRGKHEVIARIATDEGVSPPMTGEALAPLPKASFGAAAREHSRRTYGRPIADVEKEVKARYVGSPGRPRPPIGKAPH